MVSLQWYENARRYNDLTPPQFAFNFLSRSKSVTYENLKLRDPKYGREVNNWYVNLVQKEQGFDIPNDPAPPPMFTPYRIRELVLQNRVVVSPMCQYSANDGTPTDWHLVHLGGFAVGGAGLVYTEMTNVSAAGRITPGCAGMYKPEHVKAWQRVTRFIHQNSAAKVCMQLAHAGRKGSTKYPWHGEDEPLENGNWPLISASPLPFKEFNQVPKEMARDDMDEVLDSFVRAARMAEEAEFDMIEIHMAHGYLLSSFISPVSNVRRDEYGGELVNRLKFPVEILKAVRSVWPNSKPISCRISATDWLDLSGLYECCLVSKF